MAFFIPRNQNNIYYKTINKLFYLAMNHFCFSG
jgi:hypothetical protein